MIRPTRDEFAQLARDHSVVPVWREVVGDLETPVSMYAKLAARADHSFLLESVEHGQSWGRFSFVGRDPSLVLVARDGQIVTTGAMPAGVPTDQGVLAAIEGLLSAYRSPTVAALPPLHGGIVGYLSYDVVREIERLSTPPPDDLGYPQAVVSVIGQVAAFDHWRQRIFLIDNVVAEPDASPEWLEAAFGAAVGHLDAMAADLAQPLACSPADPPDSDDPPPAVTKTSGPGVYCAAVEAAREYMRAGDIFQVALSQRFDFQLEADPFDVYRVLRQINPSPYMYFLRQPELTLVGSSPERMVQLRDGLVVSRPIAGTRQRSADPEEDRRLAAELAAHPKEVAEHVMLVDLARNDVGRIAKFGSEEVRELMVLERYSHVMHLTSEVTGRVAEGVGAIDVLRATFPAGTVSGAPKVRAMEIIDELEPVARGPYAGVVGYFDFSGNLDTAIAIRTMLVSPDGGASVQAGAGIVVDSDPESEDLECANKAAALLAAVPAARRMRSQRAASEFQPPATASMVSSGSADD